MPRGDRIRTTQIGTGLLVVVVPAAALAIGSLIPRVLIAVSLLAALSCALLWVDPPRRISRSSQAVLVALAILLAATVLQAIPLPAGVVAAIAPGNADVWARALTAFREAAPTMHPLSTAPPATHVEILRGVLYGCILLGAIRVTLNEGGTRLLEIVIIASACGVALVTLAHPAVQAERVYGLYHPREVVGFITGRIGPLLNPNHVAAYVNVGALVATGVTLAERRLLHRVSAGAAGVLLAGTSVWAGSRGGTVTLILGAIAVVALAVRRRRERTTLARVEIVVLVIGVLGAGSLVGLSASDVARGDLVGRDTAKLTIIREAFRLVSTSPIFGIGRGAFETMFPSVHDATDYYTFLRPENVIAQWTTEWGIPISIAAILALGAALRPSRALRGDRPPYGAWVAFSATAIHELVDFHLEVPGVVVLVTLCVAIVVGRRSATEEPRNERRVEAARVRRPRLFAFALAPAALAAATAVWTNSEHTVADDRDAIGRMVLDPDVSDERFARELRSAILRYPAEPYLPLAAAIRAQARGQDVVIPWIARALERFPKFGRAHLVLARTLAAGHPAQARLEYRLAYATDTRLRGFVVNEAPRLVDDRDSALELVVDGEAGLAMLESLTNAISDRLPATAARLSDEVARRDPKTTFVLKRRAEEAISDVRHAHPWCLQDRRCADDGVRAARAVVQLESQKCESHELVARVLIADGRAGEALDGLALAMAVVSDRGKCIRTLALLALRMGDQRRADSAMDQATRAGCGTREDCLDLYAWAASTEESRGNRVRAIALYKRAAELTPEDDRHLLRVGELAEEAGLMGEAADAYATLARRHPGDSKWRERSEQVRKKAHEQRLRRTP